MDSMTSVGVPVVAVFAALALALVFICVNLPWNDSNPPKIEGTIPLLSNSYQFMTDKKGFLERIKNALNKHELVTINLGGKVFYMTTKPENVQAMFRSQQEMTSDVFILGVMEHIWGMSKEELQMFRADKSGRSKTPLPGTENTPDAQRVWAGHHHVYAEYLSRTKPVLYLATAFSEKLMNMLCAKYHPGEWHTVRLNRLFRRDIGELALTTFIGTRIMELQPGFMDCVSEFETIAHNLVWGLPKWMNPYPWKVRKRFHAMTASYLESAWETFDWDGPDADSDWEPNFGSRVSRELAKWMKTTLKPETAAGLMAAFVIGIDANAMAIALWAFMEVVKAPSLFQALKDEVADAFVADVKTGTKSLNIRSLVSLPLLQSVYTEALRMHVSVIITREVHQPTVISRYRISNGSVIQAPSSVSHYDEKVWGTDEHGASEFWGQRHLKYSESKDASGGIHQQPTFSMAGRSRSYYPYGGGVSMCPGRHFAKYEIMIILAVLTTNFEVDFVRWTNADGTTSDRPAENDSRFFGVVAMPPDRDMEVRWRRV
ncbi:hypothetical protein ED733_000720 [Metarhizium rileyi]|uniref:Cytochrome P450 n=1 Tax=Metarhizium rileyi (strain RCEF 4871) TaxID=1649241 RepID=A0A5C6GHB5_METRR|nr:hypothetical protein ED733_000720 [Metarhizium rileyi]